MVCWFSPFWRHLDLVKLVKFLVSSDIWDKENIGHRKCIGWPFCDLDPRSWLWQWWKKICLSARLSKNTHPITTRVGVNSTISTQLQLQLQKFQLQLQLQPISRISTPTLEVSIPTPAPAHIHNINSNSNSNSGVWNPTPNSISNPILLAQLNYLYNSIYMPLKLSILQRNYKGSEVEQVKIYAIEVVYSTKEL